MSLRPELAEAVLRRVERFVEEQEIRCPETVYQSDRVIINAYEFIEDLCNIAGYYTAPDEENE